LEESALGKISGVETGSLQTVPSANQSW